MIHAQRVHDRLRPHEGLFEYLCQENSPNMFLSLGDGNTLEIISIAQKERLSHVQEKERSCPVSTCICTTAQSEGARRRKGKHLKFAAAWSAKPVPAVGSGTILAGHLETRILEHMSLKATAMAATLLSRCFS
jgi:hypothetical protein